MVRILTLTHARPRVDNRELPSRLHGFLVVRWRRSWMPNGTSAMVDDAYKLQLVECSDHGMQQKWTISDDLWALGDWMRLMQWQLVKDQ